jgi:hypothetical protein
MIIAFTPSGTVITKATTVRGNLYKSTFKIGQNVPIAFKTFILIALMGKNTGKTIHCNSGINAIHFSVRSKITIGFAKAIKVIKGIIMNEPFYHSTINRN